MASWILQIGLISFAVCLPFLIPVWVNDYWKWKFEKEYQKKKKDISS